MRNSNDQLFPTAGDMSLASVTSETINLENILFLAIQAIWSGTPTGTIKLQASCDVGRENTGNLDGVGVSNWTDVPSATLSPAGSASSGFIELKESGFKWARLVYTRSGGSGSLTARFNAKGV
jgi:hypothetical protein